MNNSNNRTGGMQGSGNMGSGFKNPMAMLGNLTSAGFDAAWVTQMLAMHQRKLALLQAQSSTSKDQELRKH